ncbi:MULTISPECIES: hypothetical protein [unclassified Roseibium]|uniref:hypothetical protein n=1 Tax=unclassified Roseibium TaxID=2629323 RepID=UPI00273E411C|nr:MULTISPECIES: hypothetical protein [unclassified Roseibium]
MTVSSVIEINGENVDLNEPCNVVKALEKQRLKVAMGLVALIIRMDGEEVTYSRADVGKLDQLIADYKQKCDQASGASGRGRARRVRWI